MVAENWMVLLYRPLLSSFRAVIFAGKMCLFSSKYFNGTLITIGLVFGFYDRGFKQTGQREW